MLRKLRLRILGALLAITIIGVGSLVSQSPALAVPACTTNYICFYNGTDGSGYQDSVLWSARALSVCYTMDGSENNSVGYIVNNTSHYFYVYDNASCSGTLGTIYPNSSGAMNSTWNNVISSYYRAT